MLRLTRTADALRRVGLGYPGVKCFDAPGELHDVVQMIAAEGARLQAEREQCGHLDLDRRYRVLWAEFGVGTKLNEIAATGHVYSRDLTMEDAAREMFNSWRQSSGHWVVASAPHRYYGVEMSQGRNGVWYGCITTVD